MSANSLIVYLLGAMLLIGGISYACFLMHMPTKWIVMLGVVMLGLTILALSRKMGGSSGPGAPSA